MKKNRRILIIGAGLAGLSTARHLQKRGFDCQILEQESDIGGLCRSHKVDGFVFDYCGHLLHFRRKYTLNFVKAILGSNFRIHQRNAWVYSCGKYIPYPFQANLSGLPPRVIQECLLGVIRTGRTKSLNRKTVNFHDWIIGVFGRGIARHFMVPYNTKFWTVSPRELTCDWFDGFIPVPSIDQMITGAIQENPQQFGYNTRFWYPRKGGIENLPLALSNGIKNIHTGCRIAKIDLESRIVTTAQGNKEKFDFLISTIPLPELPRLIENLPGYIKSRFAKLKWNSIFNLNLGIDRKDTKGRHWIYFPEKDFCFFRVGFYNNLSTNLCQRDKSSLYIEVSYSQNKPLDKANIIDRIKKDLKKAAIISEGDRIIAQHINDIKYGYPIYDRNYGSTRSEILKFLRENRIITSGRYGSWSYMSMDDVIWDGKRTAESIVKSA
jgi:protoporphyrinogen oxidase